MEAVFGAVVALLVVALVVGAFVLARGYESAAQRRERHRLKAELAAARMLLRAHGIPFDDDQ
jgi:hypothetical protein